MEEFWKNIYKFLLFSSFERFASHVGETNDDGGESYVENKFKYEVEAYQYSNDEDKRISDGSHADRSSDIGQMFAEYRETSDEKYARVDYRTYCCGGNDS